MSDPNAPNAPYRTPLVEDPPKPIPWIVRLIKFVCRASNNPENLAISDLRQAVLLLAKRLDDLEAYLCTLNNVDRHPILCPQLQIQRIEEAKWQTYGGL